MTITRAADETVVAGYRLYWGSDSTTKLSGAPILKEIEKTGSDVSVDFGGGETGSITSSVPANTSHLLIYTYNADNEADTPYAYEIEDCVVERVADMSSDSNDAYPGDLTVFNNKLYFRARLSTAFMEYNLWNMMIQRMLQCHPATRLYGTQDLSR